MWLWLWLCCMICVSLIYMYQLMEEEGGMAINFHIHTPICNPSRSELLSGTPSTAALPIVFSAAPARRDREEMRRGPLIQLLFCG